MKSDNIAKPVLLRGVEKLVLEANIHRYDQLLLMRTLESNPDFRYCANPNCSAGQIIENGSLSLVNYTDF